MEWSRASDVPAFDLDNAIRIEASAPDCTWESKCVNLNGIDTKKVFMPSMSPITTAVHCGKEPLFGCAFSTLDIAPGSCQRCDGISLFPSGSKWVTLAYMCANLRPEPIYASCDNVEKVSKKDRKLIALAQEILSDSFENLPIKLNSNLVETVDVLFAEWYCSDGDRNKGHCETEKSPKKKAAKDAVSVDQSEDIDSDLFKENPSTDECQKIVRNILGKDVYKRISLSVYTKTKHSGFHYATASYKYKKKKYTTSEAKGGTKKIATHLAHLNMLHELYGRIVIDDTFDPNIDYKKEITRFIKAYYGFEFSKTVKITTHKTGENCYQGEMTCDKLLELPVGVKNLKSEPEALKHLFVTVVQTFY